MSNTNLSLDNELHISTYGTHFCIAMYTSDRDNKMLSYRREIALQGAL